MSAPAKRTRRPRTDPGAARETVLDAAEALLRAQGPAGLRLGEIAARSGLSHSNVLYHFDGMKDLEAQLGRRIAIRLAEEIADVHRSSASLQMPETAAQSTAALFAVLAQPENARLIWWMLVSSQQGDLAPLAASIAATCEIAAGHPEFAGLPREAVVRELIESTQVAVAAALGLGIIRPWAKTVFGIEPSEAAFVDRLTSVDITWIERVKSLLTNRQ